MLTVNRWPHASKYSQKNGLRPVKMNSQLVRDYRASKHLRTFSLTSFPSRMSPNVFKKK